MPVRPVEEFNTDDQTLFLEAIGAATAAQGTLADTAVQPADLGLVTTLNDYQVASAEGRRLIESLKAVGGTGPGKFYFATTKATAGTIEVVTSTGHARLIHADGTVGAVVANLDPISFPAGGGHRAYGVQSCTSLGVASGYFTEISLVSQHVTALDVSSATLLTVLYCSDNQLAALNVSSCLLLDILFCDHNRLMVLDVSMSADLTQLTCAYNQLTVLDVSYNTALAQLSCFQNQLSALGVSTNTLLIHLDCAFNQISELDISNNTFLQSFDCSSNQLSYLNLSANTDLTYVICANNQLTELDVSNQLLLTDLYAQGNQLTTNSVNNILADLYASATTVAFVDLTGGTNAAPTIGPPDGITAAANLVLDGTTVGTN